MSCKRIIDADPYWRCANSLRILVMNQYIPINKYFFMPAKEKVELNLEVIDKRSKHSSFDTEEFVSEISPENTLVFEEERKRFFMFDNDALV